MDLAWTRARLVPSDGPARTGKGEQTCQWKEGGWVTWGCQRLNWYHTHRRSHTCRRQAPVFSADGWGRPGQLAHPGPLLSLYALVFCWNLQLKTEVLFTYYLLTTIKKKQQNTKDELVGKNCILHDGRGFNALGLMKILGINGVLLLSTFSLNFSCGLATFLAWSSRNMSEPLPEPEPWWEG